MRGRTTSKSSLFFGYFVVCVVILSLVVINYFNIYLNKKEALSSNTSQSIAKSTMADFNQGTLSNVVVYDDGSGGAIKSAGSASSITWGNTSGSSDINLTFDGNSDLSGGGRNITEGAGNDSLALDYNRLGTNDYTRHYYTMDNISGSQIVDDGSGAKNMNMGANFQVLSDWIEDYGKNNGNNAQSATQWAAIANGTDRCIEAWVYVPSGLTDTDTFFGTDDYLKIGTTYYNQNRMSFYGWGFRQGVTVDWSLPLDQWFHMAGTIDHGSNQAVLWRNGVAIGTASVSGVDTSASAYFANIARNKAGVLVDDARLSVGSPIYSGTTTFYPHRYEEGTMIVNYNTGSSGKLTTLSWDSTETGDWEGSISKTEVYGSDDSWHQIGGDTPSSPIENIDQDVPENLQIRYTLDPKTDSLQTETPKLLDVTANVSSIQPSGNYLSPSSTVSGSGILDTVSNGGWGNGSPSSTAFSANVSTPGDSSISFQFRSSAIGGDDANWSSWYPADTDTYKTSDDGEYTLTATDLSAVPTGSNRYAQVKITFNSPTASSLPSLSEYDLYYLKYTPDPDPVPDSGSNTSVILMSSSYISKVARAGFGIYIFGYIPAVEIGSADPNIIAFREGQVFEMYSQYPLFKGTANTLDEINILISSEQKIEDITYANSEGVWQYQVKTPLEFGDHTVKFMVKNSNGELLKESPEYQFRIIDQTEQSKNQEKTFSYWYLIIVALGIILMLALFIFLKIGKKNLQPKKTVTKKGSKESNEKKL